MVWVVLVSPFRLLHPRNRQRYYQRRLCIIAPTSRGNAELQLQSNVLKMLPLVLVKSLLANEASLVQQGVRSLHMVLVERIVQNSSLPVAVFEHRHRRLCVLWHVHLQIQRARVLY